MRTITIINLTIVIVWVLCSSFLFCKTISLNFKPDSQKIYFYNNEILVETDTTSLMKLVQKNYSLDRVNQIRTEINYRINMSQNDSVLMDGWTLHLYLDKNRTSYETGVLNHQEIRQLIKKGLVRLYYKNSKQEISKVLVKKEGSKRKNNVDEVFYDKDTRNEIIRINIYRKQY